ncbi:MAG: AAA family ATPase [Anaerolinea sp.]|nr:AAA family ATPase [Anaerolinea sp.]
MTTTTFDHLPHTARSHFLLLMYGAVYRLLYTVHLLDSAADGKPALQEDFPFLAGYFDEMVRYMPADVTWEAGWRWWNAQLAQWEAGQDELPLLRLAMPAQDAPPAAAWDGLDQRLALVLIGLVEEDSRFGTVFARLQEPLPGRRPVVELVGRVIRGGSDDGLDVQALCARLVAAGLVEVINPEAARVEWALRVPAEVWDAVRGDPPGQRSGWVYQSGEQLPAVGQLVASADFLARLRQAPAVLQSGKADTLILRGTAGADRVRAMGAVARALGKAMLVVEGAGLAERTPRSLGPVCAMIDALPVVSFDLTPGETAALPELGVYRGALGVILGAEGGLSGKRAESALTLRMPLLKAAQRLQCWRDALGEDSPDLPLIAERFGLPDGHIRRAAAAARAYAALDGRAVVTLADVQEACRALNRQLLDTLATHLTGDGLSWPALVVSDGVAERLAELELRCRHRERLPERLGPAFGAGSNRGVRALFTGPSGTGKTLAARILAAELGMDLYRVDLAAVVNKYIGETEKNLHRVLATAEDLDVVLLLDEGDALLGTRTEVRSANDRYANLETNYLLQRLESYQGIVLITTNAAENIDSAFQRRMDVAVNFTAPQAGERWHIWQLHLPPAHAVDAAALERIAARCAMTGGQIRNAAQLATLLALDTPFGVVTEAHLEQAVHSEYRKAGATSPLAQRQNGQRNGQRGGVAAMVDALS